MDDKDKKIRELEIKLAKSEGEASAYKEANRILADRIFNYNIMPPIKTPGSPEPERYVVTC